MICAFICAEDAFLSMLVAEKLNGWPGGSAQQMVHNEGPRYTHSQAGLQQDKLGSYTVRSSRSTAARRSRFTALSLALWTGLLIGWLIGLLRLFHSPAARTACKISRLCRGHTRSRTHGGTSSSPRRHDCHVWSTAGKVSKSSSSRASSCSRP